jgi:2-polyprenyl-6-methoxyphenol hydroxylase-like FAD-dependent oxidoreductase
MTSNTFPHLTEAEQLYIADAIRTVEDGQTWRLMFPKWMTELLKQKAFLAAIEEALPKAKVEVLPVSPQYPRKRIVAKLTDAEKGRRKRAAAKAEWNRKMEAYLDRRRQEELEQAAERSWFPMPDDEYIRRYAS